MSLSTTFGATLSCIGAMMATIDFYRKHDVLAHLWKYNKSLMKEGNKISEELGIQKSFYLEGFPVDRILSLKTIMAAILMKLGHFFCKR